MLVSEIIGNNIKYCIKDKNMDISSCSRLLMVTRQTMSHYLSGESLINCIQLKVLSDYFNKPIEWFYEEEHDKVRYTDKDVNDLIAENEKLRYLFTSLFGSVDYVRNRVEQIMKGEVCECSKE